VLHFNFYFISRLRNFLQYVNVIIDRRKDRKVRCSKEKIIFSIFLLLFPFVLDGKIKYVNGKANNKK